MKHTPEEIKYRLSNIGEAIGNIALDYITDLEKENAELKEKLEMGIALKDEEIGCIQTDFNTFKSKAKELLKRWVELYKPKLEGYPITPIQVDTEQFLNEVEK